MPGPQKTNSLAIASLVASLIGILPFICGLGSIIGIVLGVVALNQIKASGEGGRGLAIAGIAVGAVTFLISIVFTIVVFERLTMTSSDPDQPFEPFRGTEYPSLENSAGQQPDPNAPVDYPADAGLPPPVYPTPTHRRGLSTGAPGYPPGTGSRMTRTAR